MLSKSFTSPGKDFSHNEKFSSLKFMWVYISDGRSMLYYPASVNSTSLENNIKERTWWKASHADDLKDKVSGITPFYPDATNSPINQIRTIWHKFKFDNTEYILCVDLFFDSTPNVSTSDLINKYIESATIIKYGNKVSFIIQTLIIYLVILFLYELKFKQLLLKNSSQNRLTSLKMQLSSKNYASEGAVSLSINGETKYQEKNEYSKEAGWKIDISNLPKISQKVNQSKTSQTETTYTYTLKKDYDLSIIDSQTPYRCVEVWKVFLESESKDVEDLGYVVATWNKTSSVDIADELEIKSIYWEKNYNDNLEAVKNQLRTHLSRSEEPSFTGILKYFENDLDVPSYLNNLQFIKNIINDSLYLHQRKFLLPENKIITEIYKLGTINAICTKDFLLKLINKNEIDSFFKDSINERYYIEYEENDFENFYDKLNSEHKNILKTKSPFQIMIYQKDSSPIVKPQEDFCIVKINDKDSMIVYTLTDDRRPNVSAWVSWRMVDIKYYTQLYQDQKNRAYRIEAINEYLSRIKKN